MRINDKYINVKTLTVGADGDGDIEIRINLDDEVTFFYTHPSEAEKLGVELIKLSERAGL